MSKKYRMGRRNKRAYSKRQTEVGAGSLKRDSASYDQYSEMSEQEKIEAYLNENFYDKFSGRGL